jgi:hypothetical protein
MTIVHHDDECGSIATRKKHLLYPGQVIRPGGSPNQVTSQRPQGDRLGSQSGHHGDDRELRALCQQSDHTTEHGRFAYPGWAVDDDTPALGEQSDDVFYVCGAPDE